MSRALSQVSKIGDYILEETLGKGAMGTVFKGRDSQTGEIVAIKVVTSDVAAKPELQMRFAQECQVARMLIHPHIVRVLDFGVHGFRPYLVMEYVDGATLGQRMETGGRLACGEAVRLIRQVGQALHWAHLRKLIHRDVKPDNILINSAGQAKLADLGLAKNLDGEMNLTQTNAIFGTPNFMAPEQFIDAKRVDSSSDLYALAATLYMAVTGQLPFESKGGLVQIFKKKRANDIAPPVQLVPGLDEKVNAAILRGLRSDRNERPASVLEFIDSLGEESALALAPRAESKCAAEAAVCASVPGPTASAPARVKEPQAISFCPDGSAPTRNQTMVPAVANPVCLVIANEAPAVDPPAKHAHFLLQLLLSFCGAVLPAVLGIVAADRLFARDRVTSFLSTLAGLGLTFVLLWLLIGRLLDNAHGKTQETSRAPQ